MQTRLAVDWKPDVNDAEDFTIPKVAVIYDDVAAGQHAIRVLTKLFHEPNDRLDFLTRLWRFDLLEDSDWSSMALTEALNADLMVVTTSSTDSLNASVENWIRSWLKQKRGTNAAIAALPGPVGKMDGLVSPGLQRLQAAAREAEIDIFVPKSPFEPSLNLINANPGPGTVPVTGEKIIIPFPTLTETLHRITPYQCCGLNE